MKLWRGLILVLALTGASTESALAEKFDWNATSNRINSNWSKIKTPGKMQTPGSIQQAGKIQEVHGAWKVPGAMQTPAGINVKQEGCRRRLMMNGDTLFEFNKYSLTAESEKTLAALGAMIKQSGNHPVYIEGHTDSIGDESYNQLLSENRAKNVKDWLVAHQFIRESSKATGYGKRRPVAPNVTADGKDNPSGRRLNRRVEVIVDTCATFHE